MGAIFAFFCGCVGSTYSSSPALEEEDGSGAVAVAEAEAAARLLGRLAMFE